MGEKQADKRCIGFDVFDQFPPATFAADKSQRDEFVSVAGDQSIGRDQLSSRLSALGYNRFELVEGMIEETVPDFIKGNSDCEISFLFIDTDFYNPARIVMEVLCLVWAGRFQVIAIARVTSNS